MGCRGKGREGSREVKGGSGREDLPVSAVIPLSFSSLVCWRGQKKETMSGCQILLSLPLSLRRLEDRVTTRGQHLPSWQPPCIGRTRAINQPLLLPPGGGGGGGHVKTVSGREARWMGDLMADPQMDSTYHEALRFMTNWSPHSRITQ